MKTTDTIIEELLKKLEHPSYIPADDIPNIDLYMDQVTTFMNKQLDGCKRTPEDKILTKTMINNYAKNHLLPSPEKKKYNKDHLLILIFIYYLKGFLTINDIQMLISPLVDKHFHTSEGLSLEEIYRTVFSLGNEQIEAWKDELKKLNAHSKTVFNGEEDEETLQLFALICILSFDVYLRKRAIETLLDNLAEGTEKTEKPSKADAKAAKAEKTTKKNKSDRTG